jgi:ATP-dependent Clp protease protease subunit
MLICNEADGEILLYDVIGADYYGPGITAKAVKQALDKLGKKKVTARINSPGGSCTEGAAIYNLLKEHAGGVDVKIDGAAFSIASHIAMVGDKVTMAANAMMMIHDPWTIALGNAAEMRKSADILDKFRDVLVDTYHARTGKHLSKEEIAKLMAAETWLKADEAKAQGFIDEVSENKTVDNRYNLAAFRAQWRNAPANWPEPPKTPRNDAAERALEAACA